ncbi:MAG: restriction endonuclease [Candidatus Nitrosopelagicus sp.]|nr:restriction endonuclease [Candidatus Nitrosopelagicus sp.]
MHHKLIIRGIKGIIPGGVSEHDFSTASEIDEFSAKELLQIFIQNGIGILDENIVEFQNSDRIRASIFAIRNGANIEDVSEFLSWQNFEELVSRILYENGFHVQKNLILTKPRMEIDVVGIKLGISILIDCKHWKRMTQSALNEIVRKQVERVKKYVQKTESAPAIPVIVTLHQEKVDFVNQVPIVPVMQLSSFLDEFYGNLDNLKIIGK